MAPPPPTHTKKKKSTHPIPKDGSITLGVYDRPVSFLVTTSMVTCSGVRVTTAPHASVSGADPDAASASRSASAAGASRAASASVTALASFLKARPSAFLSGMAVSASTTCVSSNFSNTVRSALVAVAWAVRSYADRSASPAHSIQPYEVWTSASQQSSA